MAESKNRDLIAEASELWPALEGTRDCTRLQLVELPEDVELGAWFERLRFDRSPGLRAQSAALFIPLSPGHRVALRLAEWSHERPGELGTDQESACGVVAVAAVTLLAAATFDEVTGWFFDPEQRRPLAEKGGEDWRDVEWEKFLRLSVILQNTARLAGVCLRTELLREFQSAGFGFGPYPSTHEAVLWGLQTVANWVECALARHDLRHPEESVAEALQRLGVMGAPSARAKKNQAKAKLGFREALGDVWRYWVAPWSPRALFESELRGFGHWARGFERRLEAEWPPVGDAASSSDRDVEKLVLALSRIGKPARCVQIKKAIGFDIGQSAYNKALTKARELGFVKAEKPRGRTWLLTSRGVNFAADVEAAAARAAPKAKLAR